MKVKQIFLESNVYTILLEIYDNTVYNRKQVELYSILSSEYGYDDMNDMFKQKQSHAKNLMILFKKYMDEKGNGEIDTDTIKNMNINDIYSEYVSFVNSKDPRILATLGDKQLAI